MEQEKKNSKPKSTWLVFTLGVIVGAVLIIAVSFKMLQQTELGESIGTYLFPQEYKIVTPPVPDKITFAGEEVPLQNFEVRENFEREIIVNTYWHSSTILFMKRANRWFPVIEPILKKNNIPEDFKYLSLIESSLENVISPAGATGFWQFLKSSGREYGLEIRAGIDERYHVEKSTEAACKYLQKAYERFGSWTLAAASYNMGKTGVDKQTDRQNSELYYNLVLNSETSRYIYRILAVKTIFSNPKAYGFDISDDELYEPYETYTITVNKSIAHLADFAKEQGINYATLKLFNPWLRDNYLNVRAGKSYEIKLPKEGSIYVIPEEDEIRTQ